jgi:L-lactate dehydrogenase (cytochrome)
MPTLTLAPASTEDYRRLAERRLPRRLFDYVDGGSYAEATLAANVEAFRKVRLRQTVMRDVSNAAMGTTLLGEDWRMPLALAPIGLAGMMARRAETQAKRAADRFGVPFCLSTVSICSLEEVASVAARPFWFQLYMLKDRACESGWC